MLVSLKNFNYNNYKQFNKLYTNTKTTINQTIGLTQLFKPLKNNTHTNNLKKLTQKKQVIYIYNYLNKKVNTLLKSTQLNGITKNQYKRYLILTIINHLTNNNVKKILRG
jgi:hypothetical protein